MRDCNKKYGKYYVNVGCYIPLKKIMEISPLIENLIEKMNEKYGNQLYYKLQLLHRSWYISIIGHLLKPLGMEFQSVGLHFNRSGELLLPWNSGNYMKMVELLKKYEVILG